jgi:hypothetical protein
MLHSQSILFSCEEIGMVILNIRNNNFEKKNVLRNFETKISFPKPAEFDTLQQTRAEMQWKES